MGIELKISVGTMKFNDGVDKIIKDIKIVANAGKKGGDMPNPRKDWKIKALHQYDGASHDKVYVVAIHDLGNGHFATRACWGKRTSGLTEMQKTQGGIYVCETTMLSLLSEKEKKGYIDVESQEYISKTPASCRVTLATLMAKIDCTRLVGYAPPQNTTGAYTKSPNQPASEAKFKTDPKTGKMVNTQKKPAPKPQVSEPVKRAGREIRF